MTEAYCCDGCQALEGGKPFAIVLRKGKKKSVCERCYDKIFNPPR